MGLSIKQMQGVGFRIFDLKKQIAYATLTGNYKNYKKACIEYASEVVLNFDIAKRVEFPKITAPVFSRFGFNIMKTAFLDMFRIKTYDEKKAMKLLKQYKTDKKIDGLLSGKSRIYA